MKNVKFSEYCDSITTCDSCPLLELDDSNDCEIAFNSIRDFVVASELKEIVNKTEEMMDEFIAINRANEVHEKENVIIPVTAEEIEVELEKLRREKETL